MSITIYFTTTDLIRISNVVPSPDVACLAAISRLSCCGLLRMEVRQPLTGAENAVPSAFAASPDLCCRSRFSKRTSRIPSEIPRSLWTGCRFSFLLGGTSVAQAILSRLTGPLFFPFMSDCSDQSAAAPGPDLDELSEAEAGGFHRATLLASQSSVAEPPRPTGCEIPNIFLLGLWLTQFLFEQPHPGPPQTSIATAASSLDHMWVRLLQHPQPGTVGSLIRCFLPHAQPRMLRLLLLNGSAVAFADALPHRCSLVLQFGVVKMPCLVLFRMDKAYFLIDITTTVQDLLVQVASHWNIQVQGLSLTWRSLRVSPDDFVLGRDRLLFEVSWQPTIPPGVPNLQ